MVKSERNGTTSSSTLLLAPYEAFFQAHLQKFRTSPNGEAVALCPFHTDQNPSWCGNCQTGLWLCQACGEKGNAQQLGIRLNLPLDLLPTQTKETSSDKKSSKFGTLEATYDYRDQNGVFLYQVCRYRGADGKKSFLQRRPDGTKGWLWNLKGTTRVLYRLPEVLQNADPVLVVEGEKDAERLAALGFTATTCPGGAGKWQKRFSETLAGREVVVLPDLDEPGRAHALEARACLESVRCKVSILDLTSQWPAGKKPPKGADVSDWFDAGGLLKTFQGLLQQSRLPVFNDPKSEPPGLAEKPSQPPKLKATKERKLCGAYPLLEEQLPKLPAEVTEQKLWIPTEYRLTTESLICLAERRGEMVQQLLASAPLFPWARSRNLDTGTERLELMFLRNHRWESVAVERETAFDHRRIVRLAAYGVPVNSLNARGVVQYLCNFEALNDSKLQKRETVSSFGWKTRHNRSFFVLGPQVIGAPFKIVYEGESTGDERLAQSLGPSGQLEPWKTAMRKVMPFSRLQFLLYAAFVPPLLKLIGAPNFILHCWGLTSTGKSTAMQLAASVWGLAPSEQGGIVLGWEATKVSVERMASLFNDLPIFLDDSQTAPDKVVSQVTYMLANGVGRLRGALKGTQAAPSWHTVVFSTGEKPLSEATEYEGARARIIELYGSPFGSAKVAALVQEVRGTVHEHYGQAGHAFVTELCARLEDPTFKVQLRDRYLTLQRQLSALGTSNVSDRMAHYFASIWLTGEIVEQLFQLGGSPQESVLKVFRESCEISQNGDSALRALEFILSWVQGNRNFFDCSDQQSTVERGEIYGVIREGDYIGIFPHKFKELMGKNNLSPSSTLSTLAERKWVESSHGHLTGLVSVRGQKTRVIRIPWTVFREYNPD